jgi:UDP-2,3-diacylglucosamine hydrolase
VNGPAAPAPTALAALPESKLQPSVVATAATTALPLPEPVLLQAPVAWRAIDFISDLHLTPEMPNTFAAFSTHLQHTTANAVFILGDLFELWAGDDARLQPFAQSCVAALRSASQRLALFIMVGNRDFLMGPALLADCGATALADPTVLEAFGHRLMLTHGDALCLGDTAYQAFRAQVRSPAWQQQCLAQPLVQRLALAAQIRQASQGNAVRQQFDGDMQGDIDPQATALWLSQQRITVLVHGHTHRPATAPLGAQAVRHVLSDWDLDAGAGPGHTPRAEVLRLSAHGLSRIPPAQA